jgi:hypothetical protein
MHRDTSRIYLAEQDGQIVGISCLQLMPFVGPLWLDKRLRGNGMADKLADDTIQSLLDMKARGWFIVASSPHVPKMCERHGMQRVESPVYITTGTGVAEEVA